MEYFGSGVWSNGARWLDGTAPPPGGDAALALRFAGDLARAYTATNDLGAPFVLNRLILDPNTFGPITIASDAGKSLELGGNDPQVVKVGTGMASVTSSLTLRGTGGTTRGRWWSMRRCETSRSHRGLQCRLW